MKSSRKTLDSIMSQVEINELIERRKCRATGKVRFNGKKEATFFIYWIRWKYERWRHTKNRRKRKDVGSGRKPRQRYVYFCEHCDGYHLTKENPRHFEERKKKWEEKYF